MRYYKIINDGIIQAIGTGGGGVEITEEEYNRTLQAIQQKPPRTETTDFHLTNNLIWEEYECLPEPDPDEEEISAEEALNILLGGAEDDQT